MARNRDLVAKLVGMITLIVLAGLTTHGAVLASSLVAGDASSPATTTPDCPKPKSRPTSKPKVKPQSTPQPQPLACPTCPPVCPLVPPQAVCPPPVVPHVDEGFWSKYGKDTFFSLLGVLLGMLVSFYATILFERYKRFREVLLDIAKSRQHNEAYPISTKNLQPVYEKAIDYWRLLESKQWILDADGHVEAAAQVGRLTNFAYRSAICIEHLLNKDTKGLPADQYLSAFQTDYNHIKNTNFIQFEKRLKPSLKALLQPYPHAYAPTQPKVIVVDFFDILL